MYCEALYKIDKRVHATMHAYAQHMHFLCVCVCVSARIYICNEQRIGFGVMIINEEKKIMYADWILMILLVLFNTQVNKYKRIVNAEYLPTTPRRAAVAANVEYGDDGDDDECTVHEYSYIQYKYSALAYSVDMGGAGVAAAAVAVSV